MKRKAKRKKKKAVFSGSFWQWKKQQRAKANRDAEDWESMR